MKLFTFKILWYFAMLILLHFWLVSSTPTHGSDGDAVIVEAEESDSHRQQRQFYDNYGQSHWPRYETIYAQEEPENKFQNDIGAECFTNDGKVGTCMSFEDCSPLLGLRGKDSTVGDFSSHINLKEDLYDISKTRNCSSVIYAGTSKYGSICCPIVSGPQGSTVEPPFVNSLYADPAESTAYASTSKACGISQVSDTKIINGEQTVPGELPWMVAIFGKSGKQTCGGTLISDQIVLTAAHCIYSYSPSEVGRLRLQIGDFNIKSTSDGPHETRRVKRVIKHKYFNINSFTNDIALLRLDKPVPLTPKIQPICLPARTRNLVNQQLLVAGWGKTKYRGSSSDTLLKVQVRVWDQRSCETKYINAAPGGILNTMICAGDPGYDSCIGDSGGPLMNKNGRRYEQIGIVSFGKDCGIYPGVYTKVSEFLPWINANIDK